MKRGTIITWEGISQAVRTGVHTSMWQYNDGFSLIPRKLVGSFCIRQGSSTSIHRVVLHTVCCSWQSLSFTSFPSVAAQALLFALAITAVGFPALTLQQFFLTQHMLPGEGREALLCHRQDEVNAFTHFFKWDRHLPIILIWWYGPWFW